MKNAYMIHAKKVVTVSDAGTVQDATIIVQNGKIAGVLKTKLAKILYPDLPARDFSEYTVTPSLVDCHTHLLEFAPNSLYPVTKETQLHAGRAILLEALMSGITAVGEQICGHPDSHFSIEQYRAAAAGLPIDISFAATSISIGFEELAHYTSVTKSLPQTMEDLVDPNLNKKLAQGSDFPGENLFLNATPANFTKDVVPRAGEILYTKEELTEIVRIFHEQNKRIGVHVAGEEGIDLALEAGVDVLHHAHNITEKQLKAAADRGVKVVATPLGGTHVKPNSPNNIVDLVEHGIETAIATDAYLPPYPDADWLDLQHGELQGPDVLMKIASQAMQQMVEKGYDENDALALITANAAEILDKGKQFGRIQRGMDANLLVAEGIPGLEITNPDQIKKIFFRGKEVVSRDN